MTNIKIRNLDGQLPEVLGAGLLGDIVNEKWGEIYLNSQFPTYPTFADMALDILIEDYNQRKLLRPTKEK